MPHDHTLSVTPTETVSVTENVTKEDRIIRLEDYPSFGFWLQRRRKALDLTQIELASSAGCSPATIRKIEADERRPSSQLAEILAEQLQIPGEQVEAFVQFARGVEVSRQTGLEALAGEYQSEMPLPSHLLAKLESGTKPLRDESDAGISHNIPPQTTPFIGRTKEIAIIVEFLKDPQKRLLTVLGPGGMGKTRLVLAAAEYQLKSESSVKRFVDGIYYVSMVGVESVGGLASAVAESFDFQFSGADEPQAQLLRYLRTRHLLLVLDNFEHLPAGAKLVQAVIDRCSGVVLIVTSREKLRLHSEQLFPISGLSYPPQGQKIETEQAIDYSAVRLFEERARSIRPSFQFGDDNLNAVTAICHYVDGMPLGIVLAAAWIDTLKVVEIEREIGRGLDFLKVELGDVPSRQQSLHAAFNHSWHMLTPQEQDLYCQLAIFRGGFSAEAADLVSGASFRDLQGLINKSLLTLSPTNNQATTYYSVHELLRQFSEAELTRNPALWDAVRDKHSVYYLGLLRRHEPSWHSERQLETKEIITRESDNITAAWRHASSTGAWNRLAEAVDSWGMYYLWQGLFSDGREIYGALEERLRLVTVHEAISSTSYTILRAKSLAWQGVFLSATEDALSKLEESLVYLEHRNLDSRQIRRQRAFVLRQMSWRLIPIEIQKSRDIAEQALRISLTLEDGWQVAEGHYWLGQLDFRLGQLSAARKSTEIALAMFREIGDRRMQVPANIILAWIIQTEGDIASAERLRYETLDLCGRVGDRPLLIHCLGDLASTLTLQGKFSDGLRYAEKCVALSVEYGFQEKEGWARSVLGHSLTHLGYFDRARLEVERGLDLVKKTGNKDVETGLLLLLGRLALVPGDIEWKALAFFKQSLQLSDQLQDEVFAGVKYGGMLLAACQMGDGDIAEHYAVNNLEHVIRVRHYPHLIEAIATMALYLAHFDSKQKSLEIWQQASSLPYIKESKWYECVIGNVVEARTANLSPQPAAEVTDQDLWKTAESLLADLQ